jgi:DNA-directed RNA polymerase specialized sigma24 family protein
MILTHTPDPTHNYSEFVERFMKKYKTQIRKTANRYVIKNRYSVEDIYQYIAEKILTILNRRGSTIEDPEKYFRKCFTFYCIEYHRTCGYIFGLPVRPYRGRLIDEEIIKSYGFHYLNDYHFFDKNLLTKEEKPYLVESKTWEFLLSLLSADEAIIIDCIYNRNMMNKDISNSTSFSGNSITSLKRSACKKIFDYLDQQEGTISENIKKVLRMVKKEK